MANENSNMQYQRELVLHKVSCCLMAVSLSKKDINEKTGLDLDNNVFNQMRRIGILKCNHRGKGAIYSLGMTFQYIQNNLKSLALRMADTPQKKQSEERHEAKLSDYQRVVKSQQHEIKRLQQILINNNIKF